MTTDPRPAASHRAVDAPRPASPRQPANRVDPECTAETALELLAERTRSRESALRDVALTLSHELRTPLTTIYGGSKLLSRHAGHLSEALVREVSTAMEVDAERLLRTVEDLVVAAALPDQPGIRGEPVLLQRLLPAVAREAEGHWPGIAVIVGLPQQLPAARGDEVYLEQVLRNLLDNAAHYGPAAGRIAITAHVARRRLVVHVRDEGPGVGANERDRVFNLFEGPGTGDRQGGLGLGLFVCRRLMELMGGSIWLEPGDGPGSDFGLDLAIYPADEL